MSARDSALNTAGVRQVLFRLDVIEGIQALEDIIADNSKREEKA